MILGLIRSAKRDSRIASCRYHLAIRRNRFYIRHGFGDGHGHHVAGLQRHHHPMFSLYKSSHGAGAVGGRQHTIESIRPAAALQVTLDYATSLFSREPLELTATVLGDTAESGRVLQVATVLKDLLMTAFDRSLSGNDDAEI